MKNCVLLMFYRSVKVFFSKLLSSPAFSRLEKILLQLTVAFCLVADATFCVFTINSVVIVVTVHDGRHIHTTLLNSG